MKIIFFAGKTGGDYFAVEAAKKNGLIDAEVVYMFSNYEKSAALNKYRESSNSFYQLNKRLNKDQFFEDSESIIKKIEFDYIFLAGFNWIIPEYFVKKFKGKIINSHHSLLPAHPGLFKKEMLVESTDKFLGATLHIVDEGIDTGPKLYQSVFPNYGMGSFEKVLKTYRFIQDCVIVQFIRNPMGTMTGKKQFNEILFNPSIDEDILKLFAGVNFG